VELPIVLAPTNQNGTLNFSLMKQPPTILRIIPSALQWKIDPPHSKGRRCAYQPILRRSLTLISMPTASAYREAVEAGGFTGNTIVGTDLATLRLPAK
jgi:hypothetical protein